jgi:hypothetical protein
MDKKEIEEYIYSPKFKEDLKEMSRLVREDNWEEIGKKISESKLRKWREENQNK